MQDFSVNLKIIENTLDMRMLKLFCLTALFAGISHISAAQNPSSFSTSIEGEASITLGIDVRVEKLTDLHFGDIMSQSTGGSVMLNPSTGVVTSVTGSFQLMGTSTAASFTLIGMPGQSFVIASGSYPTQITLRNEKNNTMIVNSFQFLPSSGQLGTGGTATLKLGATLNIGANQPGGNYSNTTDLTITVTFQ